MVSFDTILSNINSILIKIASALFILFLGFIIGRFLSKLSHKILKELEIDKMVTNTMRLKIPTAELISFIIQFFVYSSAIILSLNQFGLGIKFLYFITIIVLLILIAFIITATKDLIPNIIAGKKIKGKFSQGDKLKIGNIEGTVVEVTNTDIKIVTREQDFMSIPTSYIRKKLKL